MLIVLAVIKLVTLSVCMMRAGFRAVICFHCFSGRLPWVCAQLAISFRTARRGDDQHDGRHWRRSDAHASHGHGGDDGYVVTVCSPNQHRCSCHRLLERHNPGGMNAARQCTKQHKRESGLCPVGRRCQ